MENVPTYSVLEMLILQIVTNQVLKKLSDGKASSRDLVKLQSAIKNRPDQDLLVAELLESYPNVALVILSDYPALHMYHILSVWLNNIDSRRSRGCLVGDRQIFETMDQEPSIFLSYIHHQFSYKVRRSCQLNGGSWGIRYLIHHLKEGNVSHVQYPKVFERICYAFMSDFIEGKPTIEIKMLLHLISLTPSSLVKRVFQKVPDALSLFVDEKAAKPQTIQLAAQILLAVSSTRQSFLDYKRRAITWLISNQYPQHVVCLLLTVIALKAPEVFEANDIQTILQIFQEAKAEVPVFCGLLIALGKRVKKEHHTKVLSHLLFRICKVGDQFTILVTTTLMILVKEYDVSSKLLLPLCEPWADSFLADAKQFFPGVLEGESSRFLMLVIGELGILNLLTSFQIIEKPILSSQKVVVESFTKLWHDGHQLACFHLIYCFSRAYPDESERLWRNFLNLSPIQARGTSFLCMDQTDDLSPLFLSELVIASKSEPILKLWIEDTKDSAVDAQSEIMCD